ANRPATQAIASPPRCHANASEHTQRCDRPQVPADRRLKQVESRHIFVKEWKYHRIDAQRKNDAYNEDDQPEWNVHQHSRTFGITAAGNPADDRRNYADQWDDATINRVLEIGARQQVRAIGWRTENIRRDQIEEAGRCVAVIHGEIEIDAA